MQGGRKIDRMTGENAREVEQFATAVKGIIRRTNLLADALQVFEREGGEARCLPASSAASATEWGQAELELVDARPSTAASHSFR